MADPEQEILEQSVRETEDALLQGALEKPPKEEAPPEAEPKAEPVKTERQRDPATGQFVKASGEPASAPPSQAAQPAPAGEPKADDEQVPSWRLREINEEKRRQAAELESLRADHARLQAWAAQQQRATQQQQAPPPPDPVLDPAAYTKYMQDGLRAEFAQQVAHDRLNMNLELSSMRYGERFEKAFEALVVEGQRGNRPLVQALISQPNPGAAIMDWHTRNEVLRTVGPDPDAYRKKTREELLSDPEFLAEAAERARSVALGGGQPSRANTVVRMPPSLSKATGSADVPGTATDGSEAAIFAHAMQPRARGR